MASNRRVTDLEKNPVRISKDEAPTLLSVAGPLFISSLLFHLSIVYFLLVISSFNCLFPPCYFFFLEPCQVRGVSVFFVMFTLAFTTGQTSSGNLPFLLGVLFYFPNLSSFVSSYVKMKIFCSFQFNRLAIQWPSLVRVWGWASYRFLPFTVVVFSLHLPFCFSRYIVHLRCTSEGGSLDV